jgi:hypothetical protein
MFQRLCCLPEWLGPVSNPTKMRGNQVYVKLVATASKRVGELYPDRGTH